MPEECEDVIAEIQRTDNYIDNVIEIADAIEGYCYCAFQVHLGNKDFVNKLKIMKENVEKIANKYNYVKYFMDNLFDGESFEIIY